MIRSLPALTLSATLLGASFAWASGQATPDEAKAMAVGPEKAFPEFDAKDALARP